MTKMGGNHTHSLNPLTATWTSNVASTASSSSTAVGPVYFPNTNPNQWTSVQQIPQVQIQTPTQPTEGMLASINNKLYRYSASTNEWIEVVDAPVSEIAEAPQLPVELDARGMLDAFRQYHAFLDDLDGLDQRYSDAVSDVLFGLNEAIEALERLEQR